MYAFLSNGSALEALRHLGGDAPGKPRWPKAPRRLPRWGDSVSKQLEFKAFARETDLAAYGVTGAPVNLLVPEAGDRSRGKSTSLHVWKHPVPANSFVRIDKNLFASAPEFVLLQMAARNLKSDLVLDRFQDEITAAKDVHLMAGHDAALLYDDPFTWERKEQLLQMALVACEFSGSYRLAAGGRGTAYRLDPLMTCSGALDYADAVPHLYGKTRVKAALGFAFDRSASPMETALALMLSLPVGYGGYGLPKPVLNRPLGTGAYSALWDGDSTIKPDLLWQDASLVVEYESDEFHAGQGRTKAADDATRGNVLSAMGYTVLRATTGNVMSQTDIDHIARQVAAKLGATIPEPDDLTLIRRHKLYALLMRQ